MNVTIDNGNEDIDKMISALMKLESSKNPMIENVRSVKLLIKSLEELRGLVEMNEIKSAIVRQIKFILCNSMRKKGAKFEGHMLHTVISGNPGTGKTTVAKILAKIWLALGIVKDVKQKETRNEDHMQQSGVSILLQHGIIPIESQKKKIMQLENENEHYKRILGDFREKITNVMGKIYDLNKNVIQNDDIINLRANMRLLKFGVDNIMEDLLDEGEKKMEEKEEPRFVIAARDDLVAEYVGQTAVKTRKVLESARGGVLFIDEAYSICTFDNGSKDKFGEECLTTINEFMSNHPDEIIIIFAGYKDKLKNTIFKVQPGLERRVAYFFEIKDYTLGGLSKIFHRQLEKNDWIIHSDVDMERLLGENKNIIRGEGGFTEKLALFVKMTYAEIKFDEAITQIEPDTCHDSIITNDMLNRAFYYLSKTFVKNDEDTDEIPYGMYC